MGWQFVLLSLALLPFALMTLTKSIKEQKYSYAIITGLLFALAIVQSQSFVWYPLAFILLSFFLVRSRKEIIVAIKSLFIVFLVAFIMHISWLLPMLMFPSPVISRAVSQFDIGRFGSRLNSLNLLRLWGSLYNYQYESAFPSLLVFLSFVPAVTAYFALVLRKKDKKVLYFVILSLLPLFFYIGRRMLLYIPFSNVMRDYSRNIIFSTLSYPILIAMTIDALITRKSNSSSGPVKTSRYKFILGYIITILIVVNAYPLWTGELYGRSKYGYDIRLRTIRFPKEYYAVENMLAKKKKGSFKAFYLPMGGNLDLLYNKRFDGAYHEIADIFANFAPLPGVIVLSDKGIGIAQDYASVLLDSINYNKNLVLLNLLDLANIKYIIIRLNTYLGSKQPSMKEMVKNLEKINRLRLPKIYENNSMVIFENPYFFPPIYGSDTSTVVAGNIEALLQMSSTRYLDEKPVLLFAQQKTGNRGRITDKNLKNINNFVFKDSNRRDLAVELARKTEIRGQNSEFRTQNPGVYEIYLDMADFPRGVVPSFKIRVDGKELIQFEIPGAFYSKYLKIAQVEIKEPGKHLINVEYTNQNLKIILVSSEEREKMEKFIRQKMNEPGVEATYIFSRDGEFYVP